MKCNKLFVLSVATAFCVGYGCATCILSRGNTRTENKEKEYIFLGNDTVIYEEIDYSIYANGVDPNGVYNKPNGVIPNDSLAVELAKIVLFPIYGKKNIERQRPYQVTLINNKLWSIRGSLSKNKEGGTFCIVINKQDGKVQMIYHEK